MVVIWNVLIWLSNGLEAHIAAITAVIAVAAVVQWRETRTTAERQLRAYVINSSASLYNGTNMPEAFVNRDNQPGVVLKIENYGKTPAYQVKHWAGIEVAPVTNESRMSAPSDSIGAHNFVLGPGGTATAIRWLNRPITPQEEAGIINGSYAIYAYGRVEYIDAFKRPRWSVYRLKYCTSAWPPIGNVSVSMDFCQDGNDAD